jgi:hypothetical protein
VYGDEAFLRIKHWNAMRVPLRIGAIPGFITGRIGLGVAAAVAMLSMYMAFQRIRGTRAGVEQERLAPPRQKYLSIACLGFLLLAGGYRFGGLVPWLQLLFHVMCYVTLLLYWRHQIRCIVSSDQRGISRYVLMFSSGLAVFLCLMAFGPVYVSNDNLFANHILRVLLVVLPPFRLLREFYRIWIFGVLFLSIYLTVRLGSAVRLRSPITRFSVAAIVAVAAMLSPYNRQLVASVDIEAPKDFVQLGSQSRATGAIYWHPQMQWNTSLGVWMIAIARELRRPVVNGYIGLEPPYFGYASSVLHRFPDPEAVWLLRKWKVETVVSFVGDVGQSASIEKVFEHGRGVVYEIAPPTGDIPHPSEDTCLTSDAQVRIAGEWSQVNRGPGGASVTVAAPKGFRIRRMEFSFRQSVVDRIPDSIGVYALEGTRRIRLNDGQSGEWIESLAANALVRRRLPVATIRLSEPESRPLEVDFRNSLKPPIERLGLCGEWTGGS